MAAIEIRYSTMQHFLTAILIALATISHGCSASAKDDGSVDQMAVEAKNVPVVTNLTAPPVKQIKQQLIQHSTRHLK
ncbi:unnamed protein product [Colias eurytheme]|nr:unnamed protein product [Colias eurytheme]